MLREFSNLNLKHRARKTGFSIYDIVSYYFNIPAWLQREHWHEEIRELDDTRRVCASYVDVGYTWYFD